MDAPYKALDVARYILLRAYESGDLVTNLKLQKLLYYAQAWYMVHHNGKKLFEEDIEAWRYGPVVRNVYDQYKSFKGNPIDESINKSILNKFTLDSIEFIDGFLAEFIEHSAMSLVDMIHNEEPWEEAFDKNDPMPSNVISTDSMYRFYLEMLNKEIQLEKDEDAYYMKIIGERRKESTIPAEKVWSMIDVDN